MKFIWISEFFLSASVALRMSVLEGQDVKVFVKDKDYHKILEGMIDKEDNYEKWKGQGNIFITADDTSSGKLADQLRKSGELVYGGNAISDRLENDRLFGQRAFKDYGLNIVESWNFQGMDSYDQALTLIEQKKGRWCFKQNGDEDKSYNYVGKFENGDDMVSHILDMKKVWVDNVNFDLQKFVPGHECAVEGFFNGKEFLRDKQGEELFIVNWEHKKKSNDDLGTTTGEVCTLQYRSNENTLLNLELKKLEPLLKKIGYVGNVDVNFIIDEKGSPHPLEWTNRWGFPSIHLHEEMLGIPFHKFIEKTVRGENDFLEYDPSWAAVVVVSVPPFPFQSSKSESNAKGQRIYFLKDGKWAGKDDFEKEKLVHLHPYEVKFDKETKRYVCAGDTGYLLAVTGKGATVEEANDDALCFIQDNVYVNGMDYRTDCGVGGRVSDAIDYMMEEGFV